MNFSSKSKIIENEPKYWMFQLLWFLIIFPKPFQLAFAILLAFYFLKCLHFQLSTDRVSMAMILLAIVQLIAILFDLVRVPADIDRLAAAINTMILWPIAAIFYNYYKERKIDLFKVGRYCIFDLFINFVLAIVPSRLRDGKR